MPETPQRATEALQNPGHDRRSAMALRVGLGALFAATLFAAPQVASPEPVAAGSSCTGWTSYAKPPQTIKVLRTRSGRVDTVEFREYVAKVMASGEWPSRLKRATLEAGALVTKQYGWYYAMRGNHRSGYSSRGKCYDVRDDTRDQLYRPERVKPTRRQYSAIDKTWGLTLRKNDRFFLTGYRLGSSGSCATDANGWKLYERSANGCAKQGWSSKRILSRYLSPNLRFVWSRKTGPVIKTPSVKLRTGNTVASGAATLSWKPVNDRFKVARYKVQRKVGNGAWSNVKLASGTARSADVKLKFGATNHFRVRAKDSKGHLGPWSYVAKRKATIRGPVGRSLSSSETQTAGLTSSKVKVRVSGRAAALVARTGPGMGRARVYVDGRQVATVDLDRASANPRELVWARNWGNTKSRTIVVKTAGPGSPIEFNGFLSLR